jgi:hypothetical protein
VLRDLTRAFGSLAVGLSSRLDCCVFALRDSTFGLTGGGVAATGTNPISEGGRTMPLEAFGGPAQSR